MRLLTPVTRCFLLALPNLSSRAVLAKLGFATRPTPFAARCPFAPLQKPKPILLDVGLTQPIPWVSFNIESCALLARFFLRARFRVLCVLNAARLVLVGLVHHSAASRAHRQRLAHCRSWRIHHGTLHLPCEAVGANSLVFCFVCFFSAPFSDSAMLAAFRRLFFGSAATNDCGFRNGLRTLRSISWFCWHPTQMSGRRMRNMVKDRLRALGV